jgi:uncharacterized protein with HEPN domain/predicted nucleotidyltransferase
MINTPAELERELLALSSVLQRRFKVSKLGYFGSFARNEQTAESDIDILIQTPEPRVKYQLKEELAERFGRKVDVVVEEKILAELRDSILEDVRFVQENQIVGAAFPKIGDARYMKKEKKRIDLYIKDIRDTIQKILRYVEEKTFFELIGDEMRLDAVIRCFAVIGEAAAKVPQTMREKYPEVPWTTMVGFRNIVVHEYENTDYTVMWDTIQNDLPDNLAKVEAVFAAETSPLFNERNSTERSSSFAPTEDD